MSPEKEDVGQRPSREITEGIERATHRSLFYAMGLDDESLGRPLVAVVNSANELVAGHIHMGPLVQAIKLGIAEAGGTPLEFPSIAICDGLATGHPGMRMPMISRELIADSIEVMVTAHGLDAMVLLTNCDKVTPGMLMAAARLNIPSIIVSGGPMEAGCFRGKRVCYTDLIEAEALVKKGEMSLADLAEFERAANPGAGSCAMMGTANTMNMLAEALGMMLAGGALIPSTHGLRVAHAKKAGRQIVHLFKSSLLPREIMTRSAFLNAIAVDMAIGGSTNTCLHLPAIAHDAGVDLSASDFSDVSEKTPHLVLLKPAGKYFASDLYEAGGIPALMNEMLRNQLLNPDCLTVSGNTIAENTANFEIMNFQVISTVD